MKKIKLITIIRAFWLPMVFMFGISISRVFIYKNDNWLIPFIVTLLYTIWYFYDMVKRFSK